MNIAVVILKISTITVNINISLILIICSWTEAQELFLTPKILKEPKISSNSSSRKKELIQ